ncbi:hypothetical protein Syun_025225 [Stephania yunnanensis]|uniref:Uncharacterized protein n=1 Tax=Stephania yunnanensis TaxID=152371 RepID=A0AAP0ETU8_9MAGN
MSRCQTDPLDALGRDIHPYRQSWGWLQCHSSPLLFTSRASNGGSPSLGIVATTVTPMPSSGIGDGLNMHWAWMNPQGARRPREGCRGHPPSAVMGVAPVPLSPLLFTSGASNRCPPWDSGGGSDSAALLQHPPVMLPFTSGYIAITLFLDGVFSSFVET